MVSVDMALLGAGAMMGAYTRNAVSQKATSGSTICTAPFHIAFVNCLGSFILGSVYGYKETYKGLPPAVKLKNSHKFPPVPPRFILFIGVGYCGALTTFSTFTTDTLALLQASRYATAMSYVALNNVGGIGAATLGFYATGRILRMLAMPIVKVK